MRGWAKLGLLLAVGAVPGGPAAWGQVVERDVTVTGPGGRTIERHLRTERRPGGIEREVDIRRPGGTLHRETFIPRPGGGGPGPDGRFPGGFGPGREVFIERDVFVAPPPPPPGWGGILSVAAPFFGGLFVGSALRPAPPPAVVIAPEPVYVAPSPPPTVIYNAPRRYVPAPAPGTVVVDPVADALGHLQDYHGHGRRDAALTLGRLGDARAVPALMDRLKNDHDRDVRVAASWALGEIGDPKAALFLERAALYDKKQEVRTAASRAYQRLPREAPTPPPGAEAPERIDPPAPAEPSGFREAP